MAYRCPICAEPIEVGDLCSFEVSEGSCHAECLEGSPVVDDFGNEIAGTTAVYAWTEQDAADYPDEFPTNADGATIQ